MTKMLSFETAQPVGWAGLAMVGWTLVTLQTLCFLGLGQIDVFTKVIGAALSITGLLLLARSGFLIFDRLNDVTAKCKRLESEIETLRQQVEHPRNN